MHVKVYNRCVPPATPLPPLALQMDTQDARDAFAHLLIFIENAQYKY